MKIAIVKLSALGDIVHAMVVLQFIKQYNKDIDIDWIVEENFKELVEFHPDIKKVHIVKLKEAKRKQSPMLFIKELIKVHNFGPYDLIIDMQGLIKSALITKIIPSIKKMGFDKGSIRESFASNFYKQKYKIDYAENIVKRNIGILNHALGININNNNIYEKKPFLYSDKDYKFSLLSNDKKNILLVPGASFSSKCYPSEKYSELASKIDANFLSIWGNDSERALVKKINLMTPELRVANKLSLCELISLISKVDLVIGSDTGPSHFAWALNVPSIILYGSTPGFRNTFSTKINKIIESETYVNPYKINKKDFSIKNIKVEDIVKMAKEILELKL